MRAMHVSAALAIVGAVAVSIGVFGQFGLWYALIIAGTFAVVGALTLIDVDEPDKGDRP